MVCNVGDKAIDLAEPAWDAPLIFPEADERRLHLRAYHHWAALRQDRLMPAPTDLDVTRLGVLAPNAVLVELAGETPVLRYVGERLRREARHNGEVPLRLDAVPPDSVLARLTDHLAGAAGRCAPVRFEAEFVSLRGRETMSRGILMPLSSDGSTVDALFGVINWKEVAAPELAGRLAAEISAVMRQTAG
jgi:hypothetical protein